MPYRKRDQKVETPPDSKALDSKAKTPPPPPPKPGREESPRKDDAQRVDQAAEESFPASDPPAHRGHHI